jgi:hypothetical protein
MEKATTRWRVRDKARLLTGIMENLGGGAHISFEGSLRHLTLLTTPGSSQDETAALRRNTLWPQQDFVILPLEFPIIKRILSASSGTLPRTILHVQIEKAGTLQFAAYDNFDPEFIYFGNTLGDVFVDSMVSAGIMEKMR